jgi:hypothetical protein
MILRTHLPHQLDAFRGNKFIKDLAQRFKLRKSWEEEHLFDYNDNLFEFGILI